MTNLPFSVRRTSFSERLFAFFAPVLAAFLAFFSSISPVFGQTPFTCEDQFFITLSTNPPSLKEVLIDPATGASVFVSVNPSLQIDVNAAGFRPSDNFIYAIQPSTRQLVRIDANGDQEVLATLQLNPLHAFFAGDISPDGRFLVLVGSTTLVTGEVFAAEIVRVDLDSPTFAVTSAGIGELAQIYDIAFHPVTEELFGYDSNSRRVIKIDPTTGAVTFPFPPNPAPAATGSLFFDAYGNLFAYGAPAAGLEQNSLYEIDLATGQARFLTAGAIAEASDGCSCPYTIELAKSVEPRTTLRCAEVEYTFRIVNTSKRPHSGLRLEDVLPAGFAFVSVVSNPVGGTVASQPGDSNFILENIALPEGTSEIKIRVSTGDRPPGVYKNQARLLNLPPALGDERLSDDPETVVLDDSTALEIVALAFDTARAEAVLCAGAGTVRLDPSPFLSQIPGPLRIEWQNGDATTAFEAAKAGQYSVRAIGGCDTAFIVFDVKESGIAAEVLTPDGQSIDLGDSLFLAAKAVSLDGDVPVFSWTDPEKGSIRCPSCPETWAQPFNDIEYFFTATNALGCRDSARLRVTVVKNYALFFPNVFWPEGATDGANQFFFGQGERSAIVRRLLVFSRWGETVFEARDLELNQPSAGWDGLFRGQPMNPGVFVWTADVEFLDGETARVSGDLTLIR